MPFYDRLKFWNKPEAKSGGSGMRTSEIPIQQGSLLGLIFGGQRLTPHAAMQYYRTCSSVAIAVDMIADEIEHLQPVLQMEDGKYVNDHDLLRLLKSPNGFDNWAGFIGGAARHYLLTRECFYYAGGGITRPPLELFAVKPQTISTVENAVDNYPQSFLIANGRARGSYERAERAKKVNFYDGGLRELFRVNGFSSRIENTMSDSPLEAVALEAKQQIQGRVHNLALLDNGGRLSLIVQFKDSMSEDEHIARRDSLNRSLAGAGNAGRIAVVSSSDMEIKEAGTNNKDMDYAKLDAVARESLFLRYKIPLPLVNNDATTHNNMEHSVYHLYDRAVLPLADVLLDGLGRLLLPRYGLDPARVSLTYNPESIDALVARRVTMLLDRQKLGVETINELRAQLPNREPIEGGDTLYQPSTMVPVGTDLFIEDNIDSDTVAARLLAEDAANVGKP
jgi:HK97 family phage portal protein